MSNGKGSAARPLSVDRAVFDARWEQTFGAPDRDVRLHGEHCDCPRCTRIDALNPEQLLGLATIRASMLRRARACGCGGRTYVSDGAGVRCFLCGQAAR